MTAELEKKKTSAETDSESGEKLYTGRIVKSTGGLYRVEIGGEGADKTGETVDCRAKGAFRRDKLIPLTGDKVRLRVTRTGEGFITEILTRKNSLIRRRSPTSIRLYLSSRRHTLTRICIFSTSSPPLPLLTASIPCLSSTSAI